MIVTTPPSSPLSPYSSSRTSPTDGTGYCQALLPDEETVCAARARGRGRYCPEHGREYKELTRAYKEASATVLFLDKLVSPKRTDVHALRDAAAVDDAVVLTERYLDAIEEEIEGRRRHHRRFFQTKDDGHENWLKNLQTKKGTATAFLARLQVRRQHLVAEEEEARIYQEYVRRGRTTAHARVWVGPANQRGIYGLEGQARRVDWASSYASVVASPKVSVSSSRVDSWTTYELERERQRRAVLEGWQTSGYAGPNANADCESCATLFWIVLGCVLLCIWFG